MQQPTQDQLPLDDPATRVVAYPTGARSRPVAVDLPLVPDGYDLLEEVGRGGMGVVFRAHHRSLGRDVALKFLLPKYATGSRTARLFVREARIAARLQHPGIPAVHEVGELADGRPYLAMKLIRGRTLAALLKEHGHGSAKWLGVFEAVCQAVGAAHAAGYMHRDLKPDNVMVGAFGEVQVMDWGLAKAVGDDRSDPSGGAPPTATVTAGTPTAAGDDSTLDTDRTNPLTPDDEAGHDERTAAGEVKGTAAYMPPEQARGEVDRVDRRADVFALGAVLCRLLTGRPPLSGDVRQVLRDCAAGEFGQAFARLDGCGEGAELVTLAKRCLTADPAGRPADAREVAAAVAAFRADAEARAQRAEVARAEAAVQAAEQGKRRRVLLTAGGLIAAVLVFGLGVSLWQMARAVAAEAQAKTNEATANGERDAKDAALTAELAARQRAFAALRTLTTDVVERKFAQGAVLTDDDKKFLRGVIAQFDAFAAVQGDDADSRAVRAEGRSHVGVMRHRLGELAEAEADLDVAVAILVPLAADFPARPEFRRELARALNGRGKLMRDMGRSPEVERDFNAALALRQQLADEFHDRPEYRQELASSLNNRGVMLRESGRPREAEAEYAASLGIQARLAADFPTRPEFREELARSHKNRAIMSRDLGRPKDAEVDLVAATGLFERLIADFPDQPEFRRELGLSHDVRGRLLRDTTGRSKEAEADFDAALVIKKQLAADFPARPEFRGDLATSYAGRGHLLLYVGRPVEAEADFEAALLLRKQLAADFPARPGYRSDLASSYNDRCNLFRITGRAKEEEESHGAGLDILNKLTSDFPKSPGHRQDLALSHNNRGALLRKLGRNQEAERDYDAALEILKKLVADYPSLPRHRGDLARGYQNRGNVRRDAGQPTEAAADYAAAWDLYSQLVAGFPDDAGYRNDLAVLCIHMARLHRQNGDAAAAKQRLDEALPHLQAALKSKPNYLVYRETYRDRLSALAGVHAFLLEPRDALHTAETCRDLGWKPSLDAYDAACGLSLCIPVVEKHPKLDEQKRREAVKYYGDEAVKMLRVAVDRGWTNAAHMREDIDLAPLRGREDFKKLIA